MKTLKVGIVGLGIGRWHLESFNATRGAEVVALCDLNEKLLAETGAEFGVRRLFSDYRELVADPEVEAVSVCVPNNLHRPVARAALDAGKHVLCEKPLAASAMDARRLVRTSRRRRRVFMVGMKLRYSPEASWIRRLADRGRLGNVYHACGHYLRPPGGIPARPTFIHRRLSGGGALIDNGVHVLDLAWYLMGTPRPVAVFGSTSDRLVRAGAGFGFAPARARGLGCDVEDFGAGMIRFENGASVYLDIAWASYVNGGGMGLRVLGDRGGATLWPFSVTLARGGGSRDATPDLAAKGFRAPTQFEHFVDCVRGKSRPCSSAEQGLAVVEMLEGIYRSNRSARAVRLA
jgi:predicted dehydrogenase